MNLLVFLKTDLSRELFIYFRLFNTVGGKYNLSMTGFEPRIAIGWTWTLYHLRHNHSFGILDKANDGLSSRVFFELCALKRQIFGKILRMVCRKFGVMGAELLTESRNENEDIIGNPIVCAQA